MRIQQGTVSDKSPSNPKGSQKFQTLNTGAKKLGTHLLRTSKQRISESTSQITATRSRLGVAPKPGEAGQPRILRGDGTASGNADRMIHIRSERDDEKISEGSASENSGDSRGDGFLQEESNFKRRQTAREALTDRVEDENAKIKFIYRRSATLFFATMILLNGILIGVQADMDDEIMDWEDTNDIVWFSVETFFMLVFSTEIILRIEASGVRDVIKDGWNIFDALLVLAGLLDVILMFFEVETGNLTFMRLLRLCRLARIVRMVRFFRALFVLLQGIRNTFRLIIWMVLLLASLIYVCSVIAKQTVSEGEHSGKYFSSMGTSMLSFFQLVTVEDWPDIYADTVKDYPAFGFVIIMFIFFTNMLLLNLITGVIVENTLQIARCDEEEGLRHLDEMKLNCLREFQDLLEASDVNGNNLLDRQELEDLLNITDLKKRMSMRRGAGFSRTSVMGFGGNLTEPEEVTSCAILKWFTHEELLQIFDLVDGAAGRMGEISFYLFVDAISRSIGVRGGVSRAQDFVMGQYEILDAAAQQQRHAGETLKTLTLSAPRLFRALRSPCLMTVDSMMTASLQSTEEAWRRSYSEVDHSLDQLFSVLDEQVIEPSMDAQQSGLSPEFSRTPEWTPSVPDASVDPELTGMAKEPLQAQQRLRLPMLQPPDVCESRMADLNEEVDRICPGVLGLLRALRSEVCFGAELLRRQTAVHEQRFQNFEAFAPRKRSNSDKVAGKPDPQTPAVEAPTSPPEVESSPSRPRGYRANKIT